MGVKEEATGEDKVLTNKASQQIVGPQASRILVEAEQAEVFLVNGSSKDWSKDGGPDRFSGYPILSPRKVMGRVFVKKLAALLLSDGTYWHGNKGVCRSDVAVGVQISSGAEHLDLVFLFPCERVVFLPTSTNRGATTPGEYFDPASAAFVALIKEALPGETKVRDLR